jgi:hypothetical protein
MELWSYINNKTNDYIRFNKVYTDDDCGSEYYFTDSVYAAIWVVDSEEKAKNAMKKFVHPQFTISPETPNTELIDIENYKLIKFKLF